MEEQEAVVGYCDSFDELRGNEMLSGRRPDLKESSECWNEDS